MEALLLIFVFAGYIGALFISGKHKDKNVSDRKRHAYAGSMIHEKRWYEVLPLLNHIIDQEPKCAVAYQWRATCHQHTSEPYLALADFQKANNIDPHLAQCYMSKGLILYQLGLFEQSLIEFEKAVWYMRDEPSAFRWRALAYLRLGQIDKALPDLRQATLLGDEHASFMLSNKGKVFIEKNADFSRMY